MREKFYEDEFNVVFRNYRRLGESIDWQALSAKLDLKLKPPKNGIKHDLLELWYVDMCKVMKDMCIIPDPNHVLYGHLPQMATTCLGSIGALQSSSFNERVNSCANNILSRNNTSLSTDTINKLVVLRMNTGFMEYMRTNHPKASQQHLEIAVLKPGDNASDSDDDGMKSNSDVEEEEGEFLSDSDAEEEEGH